jgi:hypothetical protein
MDICVSVNNPQHRPKPSELGFGSSGCNSFQYDWGEKQIGEQWEVVTPDFPSYERKSLLLYHGYRLDSVVGTSSLLGRNPHVAHLRSVSHMVDCARRSW